MKATLHPSDIEAAGSLAMMLMGFCVLIASGIAFIVLIGLCLALLFIWSMWNVALSIWAPIALFVATRNVIGSVEIINDPSIAKLTILLATSVTISFTCPFLWLRL